MAASDSGADEVSVVLSGNSTATNYALGGPPGAPTWLTIADFSGDGKLDLATADGQNAGVSILLGNGDGTFQSPILLPIAAPASSIAAGDFNGDGNPDVAATIPVYTTSASLIVMLGKGNGTFQPEVSYAVGISPNSLVAADFNLDGIPDLAMAAAGESNFEVLLGKGDGTFANTTEGFWAGPNPTHMAVGDFNGDGKPDVAVTGPFTSNVSVLLNTTP